MMIPPSWLLHIYPLTVPGIQYDDSTVIICHDSADAFDDFDCADALQEIHRYLLLPTIVITIPSLFAAWLGRWSLIAANRTLVPLAMVQFYWPGQVNINPVITATCR